MPRAYWKGYLRLSLVSCPIQLFPATASSSRTHFHQINSETGNRIKMQRIDAETEEPVDYENIEKGYEISKGEYVTVTKEELEAVQLESTRTIEIDQFVPKDEIDPRYMDAPYYLTPDGEVGQQAYAVIRDAIDKQGMLAIGRVVLSTREHMIALEPSGKGIRGFTLRYPYEIRDEKDYWDEIENEKVPKDMLDLAVHIVKSKAGHFHPEKFEDRYEDAVKELIARKAKGEKIEPAKPRAPSNVVNLMDALRRSARGERTAEVRRKSATRRHASHSRRNHGHRRRGAA
jgi:DNA end-binding protein Ku